MLGHARLLPRTRTAPAECLRPSAPAASFITSAAASGVPLVRACPKALDAAAAAATATATATTVVRSHRRRRRRRQHRDALETKAAPPAATPKRSRTHLHGRLFSPVFEHADGTDSRQQDDNNNNSDINNSSKAEQQDEAELTSDLGTEAAVAAAAACCLNEEGVGEPDDEPAADEHAAFDFCPASNGDASATAGAAPTTEQQLVLMLEKYTDPEEYSYCAERSSPEDYLDPFSFIRSLPPAPSSSQHPSPVLPKKTRRTPRYTLVLDLDETLVHSSVDALEGANLTFPVSFECVEYKVHVKLRPGFHQFLQRVSQLFEVILFTASMRDYADTLMDILDPQKRLIRHRLFREHCVAVYGNYIKDLSILDRDMSTTIIVDNSPQAFAYQLSNGVPISSWYSDSDDRELCKLLPFLEHIASQDIDVRTVISQKFRLHERVSAAPVVALQPLDLW